MNIYKLLVAFAQYNVPVTHKFDAAATYSPIVQVKDDKGKTDNGTISNVTITGNTAPVAKGSVNKASAEIGETVTFDTSETSDVDGNSGLQTRIDADGDGTYDTNWAPYGTPVNYVYSSSVNANPVVEARDSEGLTNTFVLGNLGVYDPANNPISINLKVPKYQVAGKEIKATADATDANNRPLVYDFDLDGNGEIHSRRK